MFGERRKSDAVDVGVVISRRDRDVHGLDDSVEVATLKKSIWNGKKLIIHPEDWQLLQSKSTFNSWSEQYDNFNFKRIEEAFKEIES